VALTLVILEHYREGVRIADAEVPDHLADSRKCGVLSGELSDTVPTVKLPKLVGHSPLFLLYRPHGHHVGDAAHQQVQRSQSVWWPGLLKVLFAVMPTSSGISSLAMKFPMGLLIGRPMAFFRACCSVA
jgi:hypothetical protein